ncbi:hypothetical protein I4P42_24400 [Enterobacter roggenkampii]|nr:hypothetical protein [Enterobacter roggenkampii]MBG0698079.1 hypothetical protein [Enterobacter roggenkampii]
MFAGKKSAQIREILISESAWEEMTCLFAPSLGKSRSRDGGRDIQVYDIPLNSLTPSKKWIFQCKLVTGAGSLSATKLVDVGDMLDYYDVEGFGVFTNTLIDATLYDKLDKLCKKRGVDQLNFSALEIEKELIRKPYIRARYFK